MEQDVVKLINKAKMMDLIDKDGTKYNLEPLPGLNESELNDLGKNLPCLVYSILVMKVMIPYNLSSTLHVRYGDVENHGGCRYCSSILPQKYLSWFQGYSVL